MVAPTSDHGAVFHHRQKGILLGAVEAMHLVDEQQRALAHLAAGACGVERLLQVGNAGEHRRDLLEMQIGRIRQQPRHRGLAGAGRAPEHQRTERARLQHPRQRAVGTEDVILADDLRQRARAQPVRQRTRSVVIEPRRGEESWRLLPVASDSSAERDVDLLAAAHHRDAPDPLALFDGSLEIAGPGDLLVVHRQDDIALLEADLAAVPSSARSVDHDAFGVGIEMQFVGDRRRKLATFAPWNGERAVSTISSRSVSGAVSSGNDTA